MTDLVRFGVSISAPLLEQFDELIDKNKYANRSEAIRDLIRDRMVEQHWQGDEETVGVLTVVFDHHQRELAESLNRMQHDFGAGIISTLHVHLDHNHCLEVIVVKGKSAEIKELSDNMLSVKGVLHGGLFPTTAIDAG